MSLPRSLTSYSLFASLCALSLSGCDRLQGMMNKPAAAPPLAPAVPVEVAKVDPPAPAAPPPPTPQQIIAAFQATPPHLRTDAKLQELAGLAEGLDQIAELDLTGSPVSNAGIDSLPKLPALKLLNLTSTRVNDAALSAVGRLERLEVLTLDQTSIDGACLAEVSKIAGLKSLSLRSVSVSDRSLASLGVLEKLEVLQLGNNPNLLGNDLGALIKNNKLESLRELYVDGTKLGMYGLNDLDSLKNLEVFHGNNASLGDATLSALAKLPKLRVLRAAGNTFTSDAVKTLSRCDTLEELALNGNPAITDEGLNGLRRLTKLKRVDLSGTACTRDAVKTLAERFLKDTQVVFNGEEF